MSVKPIPDGYNNVIPYMVVDDAVALLDFIKKVFDGIEIERMQMPDGSITHAEIRVRSSVIMLASATETHKAMPCMLYIYTEDTDAIYKRALDAGAVSIMEPANQFYGDRNAGVKDTNGNSWWIGTRVEDVPQDELYRRAKERNQ